MPLRIVSGTGRGRRIEAPVGRGTRPTTDRVREAIFNALGSLDVVEGATVVDLFAGSGALGIEALSRGAERCTFVESDRRVIPMVRSNLDRLGMAERAEVVHAEARAYLRGRVQFDLALLDPPYEFDEWPDLLAALTAEMVVIESNRVIDPGEGWETVRTRTYGSTVVVFARTVRGPAPE
ncbi:MAG: putative ribosomal methyltransferase [Acidimicrobiia bacterium]|nr:putative ribosomal methyltransferase [Acidimicrobiia bacterium]